jgi:hypothetical protein
VGAIGKGALGMMAGYMEDMGMVLGVAVEPGRHSGAEAGVREEDQA